MLAAIPAPLYFVLFFFVWFFLWFTAHDWGWYEYKRAFYEARCNIRQRKQKERLQALENEITRLKIKYKC